MTLIQGPLESDNLEDIADEVHNAELAIALEGLSTDDGKNYAQHTDPSDTPESGIVILPKPSVGPPNSTKICDGRLSIGGQEIEVTAYRLP